MPVAVTIDRRVVSRSRGGFDQVSDSKEVRRKWKPATRQARSQRRFERHQHELGGCSKNIASAIRATIFHQVHPCERAWES